jgi:hypothetical protein
MADNGHSSPHPSTSRHTSEPILSTHLDQNIVTSSQPNPSFENPFDFAPAATQSLFPEQNFATADINGFEFEDTNFDAPLFTPPAEGLSDFNATSLDPALLAHLQQPISTEQDLNNTNTMATLSPSLQRHSSSPHTSPLQTTMPYPQQHSRNASLTPSSAAFGYNGSDWALGAAFQGHRRQVSDARSDVSSAQHSPYMPAADSFDQPLEHSPHLNPQDPAMYSDAMGIGHISIAEQAQSYISPAHSPHHSPRLPPTQPQAYPSDNLNLFNPGLQQQQYNQLPMYHNAPEPFPSLNQGPQEMPSSDRPTPEIKFELIAPSRQPTFETDHTGPKDSTALSPPEKGMCIYHFYLRPLLTNSSTWSP